jgi:CelD/BcsL family acetyltransferase involved in cellulose biosynthesis
MIVKLIGTAEEFFKLRDEWNALLESSASPGVFLTHEWLSTWWKHLSEGRKLSILSARDGGKLIGILPLTIHAPQYARMMPRVAEFIGSGVIGSDYLDAIIERGRECDVLPAFAEELRRWGLMLQLSALRRQSCVVAGLPHLLRQDRWTALETRINVCPFINLRNHTWETYLATLGSNQRYNYNRRVRTLHKTFDVRLDTIRFTSDAERGLDAVIALHHKRWSSVGASEAFQTPAVIAFHQEFVQLAAARGWLRLLILSLNNVSAAALYGLRYGSTFYFYQSGFDPVYSRHSVGLVMMGLAIKGALEEGAAEYDLLHGDEEYKFHWARDQRELARLEVYPPHARARIYRRAIHFNRAARRMARRMLNKI